MIKSKGIVNVYNGDIDKTELMESLGNLNDGEYGYLIFDKEKNKPLPHLKYLFGVVLKTISDNLPDKPSTSALYRFFEDKFAPFKTATINNTSYEYFDLKSATSVEMDDIINKIIRYAQKEWGISGILTRNELKAPEAKAPYLDAYASTWDNYTRKI